MKRTAYYNNWLNLHCVTYEKTLGDSGTTTTQLSDWYSQIFFRLINGVDNGWNIFLAHNGCFNGAIIEVWNSVLANETDDSIDWNIEHYGGLTSNKINKINHQHCNCKTVSHEIGHIQHQQIGLEWDGKIDFITPTKTVSQGLLNCYRVIRGQDFTARTNECERYAEDFKYYFGADGCALIDDYNDDAANPSLVGKQVRWAKDVVGLKELIQAAWPVYNRLKDYHVTNFAFYVSEKKVQWYKWWVVNGQWVGQWECFFNGKFYRWSSSGWVVN